jgi:hypothetical protein
LLLGHAVQERELHMTFPSLENDFDAPPQTVDRQDLLKTGGSGGDGGDENGPVHEGQDRWGGMVAMGSYFCPLASAVGSFRIHWGRHETDAGVCFIVKQHLQVERTLIFEQRQQIDGLAGLGIEIAGKILKEMAGKLDDRAVLDQHPAIIAKAMFQLSRGRSVPGDLLPKNHFQQPLQNVFKRLIQAEADGLPGGGAAGKRLDLCGEIIAAGRSLQAFGADRGQPMDAINFSGRAFGEFQVFGQVEEVGFREKQRADGKMFGGGSRRCRLRRFFDIFLDNSIYTIIMVGKNKTMGHKIKIQRVERGTTKSYYVNFPAALAEAAQIEKGEELEWLMEDRNSFILRRVSPKKSVLKRRKSLT